MPLCCQAIELLLCSLLQVFHQSDDPKGGYGVEVWVASHLEQDTVVSVCVRAAGVEGLVTLTCVGGSLAGVESLVTLKCVGGSLAGMESLYCD